MAEFTALPANNQMPQANEYYREIERAFKRRWSLVGASSTPSWATSTGTSTANVALQPHTFWSARQNAIGTLLSNTPSSYQWAVLSSSVPVAVTTAAAVWTAATGHSGPRRYSNAGLSYGAAQANDKVGPWLVEDLQLALGVLKYLTAPGAVNPTATDEQNAEIFDYAIGEKSPPAQVHAVEGYDAFADGWHEWQWLDAYSNYNADVKMVMLTDFDLPDGYIAHFQGMVGNYFDATLKTEIKVFYMRGRLESLRINAGMTGVSHKTHIYVKMGTSNHYTGYSFFAWKGWANNSWHRIGGNSSFVTTSSSFMLHEMWNLSWDYNTTNIYSYPWTEFAFALTAMTVLIECAFND